MNIEVIAQFKKYTDGKSIKDSDECVFIVLLNLSEVSLLFFELFERLPMKIRLCPELRNIVRICLFEAAGT